MSDCTPRITPLPMTAEVEHAMASGDHRAFIPGTEAYWDLQERSAKYVVDQLLSLPEKPTAETVFSALICLSNDARPLAVSQAADWLIAHDLLAYALADAWSMGNQPEGVLGAKRWGELFMNAPYAVDGTPTDPPAAPLTLYRGCRPGFQQGMSWTSSPETAQRFASGKLNYTTAGKVYRLDNVHPEALRAHLTDRGEAEYILCPYWLHATEPIEQHLTA